MIELALQVVEQTERRVFVGESVPAGEKVVSIFEPHTDVIRKGGRETYYGHKICLSAGPSNLITDCVILDGNPRDSSQAVDMMKRHKELFGQPAEQAAFDGGFATQENLSALKAMQIQDVMFSTADTFCHANGYLEEHTETWEVGRYSPGLALGFRMPLR